MLLLAAALPECADHDSVMMPEERPEVLAPLALGSVWTYEDPDQATEGGISPSRLSITIAGTQIIEGETYYVAEMGCTSGSTRGCLQVCWENPTVFRNRSDGLFVAAYTDQDGLSNDLLLRFPIEDGAVYTHTTLTGSAVEVSVVKVVWGGRVCFEYRFQGANCLTFACFQPGVGLVRFGGQFKIWERVFPTAQRIRF